jgi:signal transduction histidine kinase
VKLTVYRKMMSGFALIIIAMTALNAYVLNELKHVTASVRMTLATNVLSVDWAKSLRAQLDDQERHAQQFLVSHDPAYRDLFTAAARRFTRGTDSLEALIGDSAQAPIMGRLRDIHEWLYLWLSRPDSQLALRQGTEEELATVTDSVQVMRGLLNNVIRRNETVIAGRMQAAEEGAAESLKFSVVLTIVTILNTILIALLIAGTIIRPIRALQAGAARVARGSFEPVKIRSHDETADLAAAFNDMSAQLKRINEYKAEMMQRIAHELRTPLQSLNSVYYLLSEEVAGPVNEKQRQYLELFRSNTERISDFTNQFLDLSKIEAGRSEFRKHPTDLRTLVTAAVENARAIGVQHRIAVTLETDEVPTVEVDREKIVQAIGNLLSNALKYTPEGGEVSVRLSSSGRTVVLSVSDTGVGIDAEDLPNLFTKFYQAKNVGKARTKGTGIGLALVKAIVEGHNGRVGAVSVEGKGSTFTLELPAAFSTMPVVEGASR